MRGLRDSVVRIVLEAGAHGDGGDGDLHQTDSFQPAGGFRQTFLPAGLEQEGGEGGPDEPGPGARLQDDLSVLLPEVSLTLVLEEGGAAPVLASEGSV